MTEKKVIEIECLVDAPIDISWKRWTDPEFICRWNFASDDWCCPSAQNDLRVNGKFSYRMEAKDGSMGFDFGGQYTAVNEPNLIKGTLDDGRIFEVQFSEMGSQTHILESFEAESENSEELQRMGWQCILNNFKKIAESE